MSKPPQEVTDKELDTAFAAVMDALKSVCGDNVAMKMAALKVAMEEVIIKESGMSLQMALFSVRTSFFVMEAHITEEMRG